MGGFDWRFLTFQHPETRETFALHLAQTQGGSRNFSQPQSEISFIQATIGSESKMGAIDASRHFQWSEDRLSGAFEAPVRQRARDSKQGETLRWDLRISADWSFDAMGFGSYLSPVLNLCWSPVISHGWVNGFVERGSQKYLFERAPAYLDHTWGREFSRWWLWAQCNCFFSNPESAFVAGGGSVEARGVGELMSSLPMALRHQGQEWIFRQTEAAQVEFQKISATKTIWTGVNFRNQKMQVELNHDPRLMIRRDYQNPTGEPFWAVLDLQVNIKIKMFQRRNCFSKWQLVDTLVSDRGACEYGFS